MKFQIKKYVFEALLTKASAVLMAKGDCMPILKNFYVKVSDSKIDIISTDLELSMIATSEMIEVSTPGIAVFPGKTLYEIVKGCEDAMVTVIVSDDKSTITCAGAKWEIHLMNSDDYPNIPKISDCKRIEVPRNPLMSALVKVKGAAAKESVRPALQMINIEKGFIMASDGAVVRRVELKALKDMFIQLPVSTVEDLLKVLKNTETENIDIGETESHILIFAGGDCFIITKNSIEYPDLNNLLIKPARNNKYKLSVPKNLLKSSIMRVRITADENTKGLLMSLSENKLELKAKDRYGNMASEFLDVSWSYGPKVIGVNHEHLLGAILTVDCPNLEILFGDDIKTRKSPLLLENEDKLAIINQLKIDLD